MFAKLREKIFEASVEKKSERSLIKENNEVPRYLTTILSVGDSAYTCSMGARICYGLQVDKEYKKNRAHIARIVGMGHDSVSAHSSVIALIKVNGETGTDFINIMPAVKFMNFVHLYNTVDPETEDGTPIIDHYILVSGTARAFRYFFMCYDFYNTEISQLANQFVMIAQSCFEIEFFDKLLDQTKLFSNMKSHFTYSAPMELSIIQEKNKETGEVEEIADINEDTAPSIHFREIDGTRVDVIYCDNLVELFMILKARFPKMEDNILLKAIFDTTVITIRLHNYSRAISQQINRHMSGISQESQRYVDYSKSQFISPLDFAPERYDSNKVYSVTIDGNTISGNGQELGEKLQSVYPQLREQGMLQQDARGYLVFNVASKALHTFTLTNYLHFIKVRTTKGAQAEVRVIAHEMASALNVAVNQMVEDIDTKEAREVEVMIRRYIDSIETKE